MVSRTGNMRKEGDGVGEKNRLTRIQSDRT
jgi:hypothetical protein